MEAKLWLCILALAEHMPRQGIMVDVGANNGASSRVLASHFRNHTIMAIEPILTNVNEIRRRTDALGNVVTIRGGLGRRNGTSTYGASLDKQTASRALGPQYGDRLKYNLPQRIDVHRVRFPIYTIDGLLFSDNVLAFAHIDVEGAEEDVLKGGMKTILRDRPIFTIEQFPQSRLPFYRSIMQMLKFMQYDVYEIPESCGADDCRNYISLPSEKNIDLPRACSCITCD